MKTYTRLWQELTSFENLRSAYEKAKKGKTGKPSVKEFSEHWMHNLALLRLELISRQYRPLPLTRFVLRDPKTRVIYKSNFRDRIVHHAIVNILYLIYEPRFIYDSFASRKGRGTTHALERCQAFLRKVTHNGTITSTATNNNHVRGYALKCDIKHYFETVDHETLIGILSKRVKDEDVLNLIKIVLEHYPTDTPGKGMPLGNWTSQFFANIYLNELDQYVKHELKAKYYVRYVDDFIILHRDKTVLEEYQQTINAFVGGLQLELHPEKSRIAPLRHGITFLGFKIFYHYLIVKQKNRREITRKIKKLLREHEQRKIEHTRIIDTLQGWNAYARHGNTYRLRQQLTDMTTKELERIAEERRREQQRYFLTTSKR